MEKLSFSGPQKIKIYKKNVNCLRFKCSYCNRAILFWYLELIFLLLDQRIKLDEVHMLMKQMLQTKILS